MDTYTVRRARPDEVTTILDLIGEAAEWLQTIKDTDQWSQPWPNRTDRDKRVANGVADGRTWMVEDDGGVVGTVTYGHRGNKELWRLRERRDPAVYVSRLIVARKHAGCGIGAALIDWAGQQGIQRWNAKWIRVDVWTSNIALHNYYEKQGFEHVRTYHFKDPWRYPSSALFQKPAADIDKQSAGLFKEVRLALTGLPPA